MNFAINSALVSLYNGAEIGVDTHGLWFQEAPKKDGATTIERPYTVFDCTVEPATAMNTTRRPHWENIDITFWVCSDLPSPVEISRLFNLLIDLFDPLEDLGAAGYDTIRIDRTGQELVPDPDKGWVYEVSYRFVLEDRRAD